MTSSRELIDIVESKMTYITVAILRMEVLYSPESIGRRIKIQAYSVYSRRCTIRMGATMVTQGKFARKGCPTVRSQPTIELSYCCPSPSCCTCTISMTCCIHSQSNGHVHPMRYHFANACALRVIFLIEARRLPTNCCIWV